MNGPTLPKVVKDFTLNFDEPHEKLAHILISVVVFSFMYYGLYLQNTAKHFEHDKYKVVKYEHFLWYSLTVTMTIPFGDVFPSSAEAKMLTGVQAILFWFIMLS
jgi:hypothetical protein